LALRREVSGVDGVGEERLMDMQTPISIWVCVLYGYLYGLVLSTGFTLRDASGASWRCAERVASAAWARSDSRSASAGAPAPEEVCNQGRVSCKNTTEDPLSAQQV